MGALLKILATISGRTRGEPLCAVAVPVDSAVDNPVGRRRTMVANPQRPRLTCGYSPLPEWGLPTALWKAPFVILWRTLFSAVRGAPRWWRELGVVHRGELVPCVSAGREGACAQADRSFIHGLLAKLGRRRCTRRRKRQPEALSTSSAWGAAARVGLGPGWALGCALCGQLSPAVDRRACRTAWSPAPSHPA